MVKTQDHRDITAQLVLAGMSEAQARAKQGLFEQCARALADRPVSCAVFAPGRIEFLGKHTDYCGGRSLLCTVDHGLIVTAVKTDDAKIRITETSGGERVEFSPTADLQPAADHWSNYPMTVIRRLARNFGALSGADMAIASDLPRAAGLSSSSALVVAIFMALSRLNNLPAHPSYSSNIHTTEDLSGYLGCVENGQNFKNLPGDRGVGTFGGSQDHTAILCSRPDALVQYRFAPVVHERTISFPSHYTLAIGVSGVVAEKTGEAKEKYNRVSLRAAEILRRWNRTTGRNDLTLAAAAESAADAGQQIQKLLSLPPDPRLDLAQRFLQFLTEAYDIIPPAADALVSSDLLRLGDLVHASQIAAEQWLYNQIPETIFLAAEARKLGAVAASAFGAGFGGSVWAMIRTDIQEQFLAGWERTYAGQFPRRAGQAQFFATRPCSAATVLI